MKSFFCLNDCNNNLISQSEKKDLFHGESLWQTNRQCIKTEAGQIKVLT